MNNYKIFEKQHTANVVKKSIMEKSCMRNIYVQKTSYLYNVQIQTKIEDIKKHIYNRIHVTWQQFPVIPSRLLWVLYDIALTKLDKLQDSPDLEIELPLKTPFVDFKKAQEHSRLYNSPNNRRSILGSIIVQVTEGAFQAL